MKDFIGKKGKVTQWAHVIAPCTRAALGTKQLAWKKVPLAPKQWSAESLLEWDEWRHPVCEDNFKLSPTAEPQLEVRPEISMQL